MPRSKIEEDTDPGSTEDPIDMEGVGLVEGEELLLVRVSVTIVVNLVTGLEIVQMETGVIDVSGAGKPDICNGSVWARIFPAILPREAFPIPEDLVQEVVVEDVVIQEVLNVWSHIEIGLEILTPHVVRTARDLMSGQSRRTWHSVHQKGNLHALGKQNAWKSIRTGNRGSAHGHGQTNPTDKTSVPLVVIRVAVSQGNVNDQNQG